MKKIAEKLIDYGMDFDYENYGSEGEKIRSFQVDVEVTSQNGKIYFNSGGDTTNVEDNDQGYEFIASMVEKACIDETSSF